MEKKFGKVDFGSRSQAMLAYYACSCVLFGKAQRTYRRKGKGCAQAEKQAHQQTKQMKAFRNLLKEVVWWICMMQNVKTFGLEV